MRFHAPSCGKCVSYKVVSYSSRSWTSMSSLYCSRGGVDELAIAKMALRMPRSSTCLSQAGYRFLHTSILITISSTRGVREDGVDGAVGRTWKTGAHPSRSVYLASRSASLASVPPLLERRELVAPSVGMAKPVVTLASSSWLRLAERPNRGPLGWKKA